MRIGLIARADRTGLAVQTYEFSRHIECAKILVVDISRLNGQKNNFGLYPGAKKISGEPYPETTVSAGLPSNAVIDAFLDGLDLVFTCETPYSYYLFEAARRRGVKTVLQYNFELFDHLAEPGLPKPDLFAAPSLWRYNEVPFPNKCFLPVPVNRDLLPPRQITELRTVLHIAGNPAMEDRNGTRTVLDAWQHVKSPTKLVVRSPRRIPHTSRDPRVRVDTADRPWYHELYSGADALVMPRKFGGLCLPLNEALSCGMPVVMSDVAPQNGFLPPVMLVPARRDRKAMAKVPIDVHEVSPADLAARIDELAANPDRVAEASADADDLAASMSWKRLHPIYIDTFAAVVAGQVPQLLPPTPAAFTDAA